MTTSTAFYYQWRLIHNTTECKTNETNEKFSLLQSWCPLIKENVLTLKGLSRQTSELWRYKRVTYLEILFNGIFVKSKAADLRWNFISFLLVWRHRLLKDWGFTHTKRKQIRKWKQIHLKNSFCTHFQAKFDSCLAWRVFSNVFIYIWTDVAFSRYECSLEVKMSTSTDYDFPTQIKKSKILGEKLLGV